ncbi:hypothetical protein DY000_02052309 [Brassica cretica]|uniref:Uncharacterized protein n=1 Tax=Brassica cretica TaxID=69181 RepID=A0ABQ7AD45_BRACR|nr:hypothetical protein DY000_02052309 [Brassica cretica]
MSVCEGRESEEDENRGLWARFRVVRFGLVVERPEVVAVGRRSQIDTNRATSGCHCGASLSNRQTRATSGCCCADLAMELERLPVVALGGHSESIFRAPKRRKDELLVTPAVGGYLRRLLSSSGTVARVVSIAVGNCLRGDLSGHGFQVRKGREIPREGGIRSRDTEIAVKGPVGSGSGSPRTEQWYALGLLVRTAVRSKPHTEKRISRWFAMYTWVSTVLQSANPCASHESGTIGLACTAGAVYWVCAWEQAMDCPVGSGWTTSSTGSVREREYVSGCKPYWRHTEGERLEEYWLDWIVY